MFASFNKAFNKNKSVNKIPEPIIRALSDKLPEGFKYERLDEEACFLTPLNDNMIISFELMNNKLNIKSIGELFEYLYRTQKKLEIKSDTIIVNGEKFNVKELVIFPLKDISFDEKDTKFIIIPPPFPEPFELPISYEENKSINIKIQRQPYTDLNKSLFKSIDLDSMEISYIIDELNDAMEINYKINLDKAKSVEEIIIVSKLYKMFETGEITINGSTIKGNVKNNKIDEDFNELIEFWKKVDELSKYFDVNLKPKKQVSFKEFKIIDDLYKSFIEDIDIEEYEDTTQFTLTFNDKIDDNKIKTDSEIMLQLIELKEFSILEEKFRLFSVLTLSEFKIINVSKVQENPFKYEFNIKPLNDEGVLKKVKFFKNEEEVQLYRANSSKIN